MTYRIALALVAALAALAAPAYAQGTRKGSLIRHANPTQAFFNGLGRF